jgi:hypothetical protein
MNMSLVARPNVQQAITVMKMAINEWGATRHGKGVTNG